MIIFQSTSRNLRSKPSLLLSEYDKLGVSDWYAGSWLHESWESQSRALFTERKTISAFLDHWNMENTCSIDFFKMKYTRLVSAIKFHNSFWRSLPPLGKQFLRYIGWICRGIPAILQTNSIFANFTNKRVKHRGENTCSEIYKPLTIVSNLTRSK